MLCFSTASLLPALLWADCLVDLLLWLSAWRNVIMQPSFCLALRLAALVSGFPTRVWLWLPPPQRPAGPENATHCVLPREICFSSVTLAARSMTAASFMWPNVKGLGKLRVLVRWGLWCSGFEAGHIKWDLCEEDLLGCSLESSILKGLQRCLCRT